MLNVVFLRFLFFLWLKIGYLGFMVKVPQIACFCGFSVRDEPVAFAVTLDLRGVEREARFVD